jgi:hypothetical protein
MKQVPAAAVPADDFDRRMAPQPLCRTLNAPIVQNVDNRAALEINHDGPTACRPSPTPVIDADHPDLGVAVSDRGILLQLPQDGVGEQRDPYALKFADRLAATAGMGSALILLVNAAKRGSLIPASDLTQLLAPFAEVLALGFVIGLFMAFGRRAGLFGLVAFAMNFIALASLEGVEVVINLLFAKLPVETIMELGAGPLGLMLTVASILFLVGSLAFVAFRSFSTPLALCRSRSGHSSPNWHLISVWYPLPSLSAGRRYSCGPELTLSSTPSPIVLRVHEPSI